MRIASALSLGLLGCVISSAAAAQATVRCNFEGNKTSVVVTNPDRADKQCNYHCKYALQLGQYQASGSTSMKPGESKTVDEGERRSRVTGVIESSVSCQ